MEQTISRLAKILGASGVESVGPDSRMVVEGAAGGRLELSIGGRTQRVMAVLKDAAGITRCTLDVGPVTHATDEKGFPRRVTLHVGKMLIHLDAEPTLAVEVISER